MYIIIGSDTPDKTVGNKNTVGVGVVVGAVMGVAGAMVLLVGVVVIIFCLIKKCHCCCFAGVKEGGIGEEANVGGEGICFMSILKEPSQSVRKYFNEIHRLIVPHTSISAKFASLFCDGSPQSMLLRVVCSILLVQRWKLTVVMQQLQGTNSSTGAKQATMLLAM